MTEYRQNGDYDAMLRTLQKDAGILLSSLHPKAVLAALDECPAAVLASHPLAILVLMRSMFNWRQYPENAGAEGAAADGDCRASSAFRTRNEAICGANAT